MTPPTPLPNDSITSSNTDAAAQRDGRLSETLRSLKGPTQFVSFWAAVALPFVHVTLLAYGLDHRPVALAFIVLLVVNVIALYVGHGYNQTRA
ncbi:hypothetical protein [Natronobiforma cellulositropha]|uniref:hypothetical protein n=1 Tax=Natronobiforma cellulositropha TaxID=1679076 RepID=UPI0021D58B30|nr:hypothetical protein [Natronobiforma cellulositropha]